MASGEGISIHQLFRNTLAAWGKRESEMQRTGVPVKLIDDQYRQLQAGPDLNALWVARSIRELLRKKF